jgi:two-component system uhpT operon response regulator UhpA
MSMGESPAQDLQNLSPRERQVFELLVGGLLDDHAIGERLGIRRGTVQTYKAEIYRKLRVHSLAALLMWAARHGRLQPPT